MKTISKILMVMLALNMATSCKKIKQRKPIIVNFQVINPVTKKGYENVKWHITQIESQGGFFEPSIETTFMEGVTDANGKARIEFKRPMSTKISYNLKISSYPFPGGIANEYNWELQNKTEQDITAYASEKVNFVLHVKNTNCFDANDEARITFLKSKYYGLNYHTEVYEGCYDTIITTGAFQDFYPYTIEVVRNGQTTIINDEFSVNTNDTINIFY